MSKAFIFGNNVDTDVILPGSYLNLSRPEDLAKVCMEGFEKGFASRISRGDIFVAGSNFGCGSSREHAPLSIRAAGVSAIIAISFSRIFYRNAINIGLPIIESREAVARIEAGDEVGVDVHTGIIHNVTKNEEFRTKPFPKFIIGIIEAGGMINHINRDHSFQE
ncbi:MAG: 3-isopropylmalate dehydratase small subunit [Rhodopila sp.]|nr:3-isopropylmalate dehydratase small subunit [Rhodopila sp.]